MGDPVRPVVLTIAGLDPGGGAGIVADIRAIEAHGCWAAAVVTTLTVQTVRRVGEIHTPPPALIRAQIEAVFDDHPVAAVKIGLLGNPSMIDAVADGIAGRGVPVVLDPVCAATSGARFLDPAARDRLRGRLLPHVAVLTPNREEARWLARLSQPVDVSNAARVLLKDGVGHVLVTGAKSSAGIYEDRLYTRDTVLSIEHREITTNRVHGTGCLHSASIAAHLARGATVPESARAAAGWMERVLDNAVAFGGAGAPDGAIPVIA